MTEHLPECAVAVALPGTFTSCICEALRACEKRMLDDDVPTAAYHGQRGYEQGQRDVFALHPQWAEGGMCKPNCLPCCRLTELIIEREAGYNEGQRDAIAAAVQRVEALFLGNLHSNGFVNAIIAAIKGEQP